jgi:hypothetical protein
MGSHMLRPIGVKRAKAAARSGTPSSLEEPPHPPTVSVAAMAADKLTATLGKIFGRAKKKDSFKMKAKIWETMVFYKKHAAAKRVAEELWAYDIDDEDEEALVEEEKVDEEEQEEEDEGTPPSEDVYLPLEEDDDHDVQQVDDAGDEEEDVQVVRVVVGEDTTRAHDNSTQDTSDGTTVVGIVRHPPEERMEEEEATSVNLLDDSSSNSSGSNTLSPVPARAPKQPLLPLYTNKPPYDKPLKSTIRANRQVKEKSGPSKSTNSRRPVLPQGAQLPEEFGSVDTALFNTQALMAPFSRFTDRNLPPPPPP